MVTFADEEVLAVPRAVVWKALEDHRDDAKISTVHPPGLRMRANSRRALARSNQCAACAAVTKSTL
jgi:hypothetical protein